MVDISYQWSICGDYRYVLSHYNGDDDDTSMCVFVCMHWCICRYMLFCVCVYVCKCKCVFESVCTCIREEVDMCVYLNIMSI